MCRKVPGCNIYHDIPHQTADEHCFYQVFGNAVQYGISLGQSCPFASEAIVFVFLAAVLVVTDWKMAVMMVGVFGAVTLVPTISYSCKDS